jgi:putative transposase
MPRRSRLDLPGLVYHVIARGIERRPIFINDADRQVFLNRLGEILNEMPTPVYAFVLMPNHFHLLLRRSNFPLATIMRRLLTSYALYFNTRNNRAGHLFQNRYKAIICQEEPYFLQLIRYIHLNPVRANPSLCVDQLQHSAFSGHSFLIGKNTAPWFDANTVLNHFAATERAARRAYMSFLYDGLGSERDFSGGGMKRSLGPLTSALPLDGRAFDDRILGDSDFVEGLLDFDKEDPEITRSSEPYKIIESICRQFEVTKPEITGRVRTRQVTAARAILAHRLTTEGGLNGAEIARRLNMSRSAVAKLIPKGRKLDR